MNRIILVTILLTAVALLASNQNEQKPQPKTSPESFSSKSKGYVLQRDQGEKLADPRGGIIKVSPEVGSQRFSMVVQPLPTGQKIGVHLHERDEEVYLSIKAKGQSSSMINAHLSKKAALFICRLALGTDLSRMMICSLYG